MVSDAWFLVNVLENEINGDARANRIRGVA